MSSMKKLHIGKLLLLIVAGFMQVGCLSDSSSSGFDFGFNDSWVNENDPSYVLFFNTPNEDGSFSGFESLGGVTSSLAGTLNGKKFSYSVDRADGSVNKTGRVISPTELVVDGDGVFNKQNP